MPLNGERGVITINFFEPAGSKYEFLFQEEPSVGVCVCTRARLGPRRFLVKITIIAREGGMFRLFLLRREAKARVMALFMKDAN